MTAVAFNSLQYAKNLESYGFSTKQAEGLAHENLALLEQTVASKQDLDNLRLEISKDREISIERLKSDLLKWYIGSIFLQMGLVVALIKLL